MRARDLKKRKVSFVLASADVCNFAQTMRRQIGYVFENKIRPTPSEVCISYLSLLVEGFYKGFKPVGDVRPPPGSKFMSLLFSKTTLGPLQLQNHRSCAR